MTFTVDQVLDLPVGSVIENAVDIYFDFNEPIRTNTTRHEIFDGFPLIAPCDTSFFIDSVVSCKPILGLMG